MDKPRGKEVARRRLIKRIVYITLILIAVPLITWGLSRLKPAAPEVELATVWPDTVRRGPMVREVRGLGTLVAKDFLWIPAQFDGRVEKINVLPGSVVHANDVLMVMSNPQMEVDSGNLEWQVKAAEANATDLKVKLETQQLQQKSITEKAHSDYQQAALTAEKDKALFDQHLEPELTLKLSEQNAAQLKNSWELAKQQLDIFSQSMQAQIESQKVNIDQLRASWDLKKKQVAQLTIRAGVDGVVSQLGPTATPLEVGQRVAPGAILAKVTVPGRLKATLKIPETQAKDVQIGQVASVDTRNGVIPGKVTRVDPAATNGTVDVDVALEGPLPEGARPDLSVDGTITIEKLADVVFVGRPVIGQAGSKIGLFKIDPDGKGATRTTVTLGRASVSTIEVVDGLKVGDRVILSDMSAWDQHNRIRLR
jgi:HlyD family secretion protein